MADTSGTMACTIAVKLHRRNLEQVKETPEPRAEDRSTIFAMGTRASRDSSRSKRGEREREKKRQREITCTHVRRRYRPPSASSVLGLFSYFHVKRLFGLGHRGLLPRAWTGPVIKFICRCRSVGRNRTTTAPASYVFRLTNRWHAMKDLFLVSRIYKLKRYFQSGE